MNRIINGVIIFLVVCVVIVFGIILFRYITFTPHTISFHLNGADRLTIPKITCKRSIHGCIIHLPKATRTNGVVLGFSENKDDSNAKYYQDTDLSIDSDLDLYVISYNDVKINIEKNDVDYLEKNELSCTAYNENKTCKIKMPIFNKKGYQLQGFSTSKEAANANDSYFPNQEHEFSESMTLYPNYNTVRGGQGNKVYSVDSSYTVDNHIIVDFEKGLKTDTIDTYKKIIEDINQRLPYYIKDTKITILDTATFYSIWGDGPTGVNYSHGTNNYPLSRSLDILSSWGDSYADKYYVVIHELGHSFDFYYGYGVDKPKPITKDYYAKGGNSISNQNDIKELYNKYCGYGKKSPLGKYSCKSITEFTAESLAQYYGTFVAQVPTPKIYYTGEPYPDDLKKVIEKYLCIAKNDYDKTKCNA